MHGRCQLICVIKNNGGETMGEKMPVFAAGSGEQQFWGSIECEMGLWRVIEVNWRREARACVCPGIQVGYQRTRTYARTHTCTRNDFIMSMGRGTTSAQRGANICF